MKKLGGGLLRIDRWVLQWITRRRVVEVDDEGAETVVNIANRARGKRYKERLAESLGLQDPNTLELPGTGSETTAVEHRFLRKMDQSMRAVALRIYMREKESQLHKMVQNRGMTPEVLDDLEAYINKRREEQDAYDKEREKAYAEMDAKLDPAVEF